MAALTSDQRADAALKLIRKMFVEANETAQLTTTEVRTLIDDLDDYVEANLTEINQAITAGVRSKATAAQKAMALAYVAMKRGGVI